MSQNSEYNSEHIVKCLDSAIKSAEEWLEDQNFRSHMAVMYTHLYNALEYLDPKDQILITDVIYRPMETIEQACDTGRVDQWGNKKYKDCKDCAQHVILNGRAVQKFVKSVLVPMRKKYGKYCSNNKT